MPRVVMMYGVGRRVWTEHTYFTNIFWRVHKNGYSFATTYYGFHITKNLQQQLYDVGFYISS